MNKYNILMFYDLCQMYMTNKITLFYTIMSTLYVLYFLLNSLLYV